MLSTYTLTTYVRGTDGKVCWSGNLGAQIDEKRRIHRDVIRAWTDLREYLRYVQVRIDTAKLQGGYTITGVTW